MFPVECVFFSCYSFPYEFLFMIHGVSLFPSQPAICHWRQHGKWRKKKTQKLSQWKTWNGNWSCKHMYKLRTLHIYMFIWYTFHRTVTMLIYMSALALALAPRRNLWVLGRQPHLLHNLEAILSVDSKTNRTPFLPHWQGIAHGTIMPFANNTHSFSIYIYIYRWRADRAGPGGSRKLKLRRKCLSLVSISLQYVIYPIFRY